MLQVSALSLLPSRCEGRLASDCPPDGLEVTPCLRLGIQQRQPDTKESGESTHACQTTLKTHTHTQHTHTTHTHMHRERDRPVSTCSHHGDPETLCKFKSFPHRFRFASI